MDETIIRFIDGLLSVYNEIHNTNLTHNDITKWELSEELQKIFHGENFFLNLKPYPGAYKTIQKLSDEFNIYLITNPSGSYDIAAQKYKWISTYMPDFPLDNVIMTAQKHLLCNKHSILIDDGVPYLNSWWSEKIVIDRLYNKECEGYRVYNNDFDEIYKVIHEINRKTTFTR